MSACKNDWIQTKIIATIGPACQTFEMIEQLFLAGVRVFRLNFSHGDLAWHSQRAAMIRAVSEKYHEHLTVLTDLQGAKIRLGDFKSSKIYLEQGARFILRADPALGDETSVSIDRPEIFKDIAPGDLLLIDDGKFALRVEQSSKQEISTIALDSGWIFSRKGLNRRGKSLDAPGLTKKDLNDIKMAADLNADYIGLSFVQKAEDVTEARKIIRKAQSSAKIVTKIECAQAVSSAEEMKRIIQVSDVIMIARGDLGVEIGDAALAMTQKRLTWCAKRLGVPVITATQIMESMIQNTMPTRAEVLDLSNAIIDGTAAVMLSAETTIGQFPIKTIKKVVEICRGVELELQSIKHHDQSLSKHLDPFEMFFVAPQSETNIILQAAAFALRSCQEIAAVFILTASAKSVLTFSSVATAVPIFTISESELSLRQSQLCRSVYPLFFPSLPDIFRDSEKSAEKFEKLVIQFALDRKLIKPNQKVMFIRGSQLFVSGGSNTMRILKVQ